MLVRETPAALRLGNGHRALGKLAKQKAKRIETPGAKAAIEGAVS